jgi:hypothetical protein
MINSKNTIGLHQRHDRRVCSGLALRQPQDRYVAVPVIQEVRE